MKLCWYIWYGFIVVETCTNTLYCQQTHPVDVTEKTRPTSWSLLLPEMSALRIQSSCHVPRFCVCVHHNSCTQSVFSNQRLHVKVWTQLMKKINYCSKVGAIHVKCREAPNHRCDKHIRTYTETHSAYSEYMLLPVTYMVKYKCTISNHAWSYKASCFVGRTSSYWRKKWIRFTIQKIMKFFSIADIKSFQKHSQLVKWNFYTNSTLNFAPWNVGIRCTEEEKDIIYNRLNFKFYANV